MVVPEVVKRPLRAVRSWTPLNVAVTSLVRGVVQRTGQEPGGLVRYLPRVGTVDAPLPGGATLRLWSRGDDDVASAVFWRGWAGHEPETAPLFFELASRARVTIDVGAHVGYFSLLAAFANRNARVCAFEPLPKVYARLERNVSLNGLTNVSCHRLALGRKSDRAEFFHVSDSIPSSSSLSRAFMESIVVNKQLVASEVDVTTFDEFAATNNVNGIDLIKIDTEATEDQVIGGMVETLARDHPRIVCEVLPDGPAEAIEEILRPLGYQYSLLTDKGPQPCPHIVPDERWRNFLFEPSER